MGMGFEGKIETLVLMYFFLIKKIKTHIYISPKDILYQLNGFKIKHKMDLKKGMEIDDFSCKIISKNIKTILAHFKIIATN
jgi:hypothetical protein